MILLNRVIRVSRHARRDLSMNTFHVTALPHSIELYGYNRAIIRTGRIVHAEQLRRALSPNGGAMSVTENIYTYTDKPRCIRCRIRFGKEARYTLWYNVALACRKPRGIDIECELAWCETRDKSPVAAKMARNRERALDNHANRISICEREPHKIRGLVISRPR
jgi:hypothetical protein